MNETSRPFEIALIIRVSGNDHSSYNLISAFQHGCREAGIRFNGMDVKVEKTGRRIIRYAFWAQTVEMFTEMMKVRHSLAPAQRDSILILSESEMLVK